MTTVGYISKINDIHYFYSVVNNQITVQSFSGPSGVMQRKLHELTAESFLVLFEDFLLTDAQITDRGKDMQLYQESEKRIRDFMKWAHENKESSPGSVCDNAYISTKFMRRMIDIISDENPKKKDLIFLMHCVTFTYEKAYKIEIE